jgi:hypothetical protein
LALPAIGQAQFNFITNNNAITITKYTGPGGAVSIPDTTNDLKVTAIASLAFSPCPTLTSVIIPDTVTNIGDNAFYNCTGLTNLTIGNSLAAIGSYAFANCPSLPGVALPGRVTNIGNSAFYGCAGLTSLTLSNSLRTIGDSAFYGCASLTNITIPNSVSNIGTWAFGRCDRLAAITVTDGNSFYRSVDGVLFDLSQATLIQCPGGKAGSYTVPAGVTNISAWSFYYCAGLTNLTLPSGVSAIGWAAFRSCTGLASITLPESVTVIDNYAFDSCSSLARITLPTHLASLGWAAFRNCASLAAITLPNTITNLAGYTFYRCTSLTSATIGRGIINIGDSAFEACAALATICFEGNAPNLGADVFTDDNAAVVYHVPGTASWDTTFGGRPTMLWNPQIQTGSPTFGVRTNQFGFTITGTSGLIVVVEACTNLADPGWSPLQSCTLTGGSSYFSDSSWTNQPERFYRLRSP